MSRRRPTRATVRLHPGQQAFCLADAPYRGFVGGVGSGKSWAGAYDLLTRARPGRLYLACAPTYPMLRDASLRTLVALARDLRFLRDFRYSEMVAVLGNGAEVLCRTADDPDRLRGPNLSGAWLDEASLVSREVYDVLIGRLREQGQGGWLSATFTPKGRSHWTYDVFGKGGEGRALFHCRTADNPFLPPDFAPRLEGQYGGLLARQELGGEFVSVEGAEFPPEYFPASIWFTDWPAAAWEAKVIALDPSKGTDAKKGDYAAFCFLGVDPDLHLWADVDAFRGKPAEFLAQVAVGHVRATRPDRLAVEANQWQSLFCDLITAEADRQRVLCPVSQLLNREKKIVRLRRLGEHLRAGRLHIRDTPGGRLLVEQLQEFPVGAHDDCPDALEMAVRVAADLLNERAGDPAETVLYS